MLTWCQYGVKYDVNLVSSMMLTWCQYGVKWCQYCVKWCQYGVKYDVNLVSSIKEMSYKMGLLVAKNILIINTAKVFKCSNKSTFLEHSWNILGTFLEHSWNILLFNC